jgi:DNA processing protein
MLGVQSMGPLEAARHPGGRLCVRETTGESVAEPSLGEVERDLSAAAERDAWVILLSVPGLGPVTFAGLLAAFGSARAALAVAAGGNGAVRLQEAMADGADGADESDGDGRDEHGGVGDPATSSGESAPGVDGPSRRRRSRRGFGADLADRIRDQAAAAEKTLGVVRALGLVVVTLDDPEYPERLRRVEMPPPLLYVRGAPAALAAHSAVAVVGTRWPSDKGRMIAGWIGSAVARAGAVLVSGLAVGIDGAAHAAVAAEGLPTVAVLGGGHARLFPRAHERLADVIVAAGGAVVAEMPPETPATQGTFPRRNRLVSGLSDATIVVEAGRRSGALITAGWALEQGRECFLVPGPFDAPTSEGCHLFLRNFPGQTRVVCGIPELLEDLGLSVDSLGARKANPNVNPRHSGRGGEAAGRPEATALGAGPAAILASLGPVERSLAEMLAAGPATADDLAFRTGLACASVLSALTLLELRGLVCGSYGRYLPAGPLARWPGVVQPGRRQSSGAAATTQNHPRVGSRAGPESRSAARRDPS